MEKRKLHKRFFAVLAVMLLILPLFLTGAAGVTAFAAETGYTGALEDLQKDENFNVEEYPDNARDYSIKVIQIAESTAGELFIYTYQPSQKTQNLVATEINMSLTENVDGTRLYSLTLLSCDGVLCKYKVDNFVMVEDIIRYYNITSIYRKWIKDIDEETGNDNTINAVAFEVGKLWGVLVENGEVHYGCIEIETIEITDKFVGYLRNWTGVIFGGHKSQDNHYVAFSTNKRSAEKKRRRRYRKDGLSPKRNGKNRLRWKMRMRVRIGNVTMRKTKTAQKIKRSKILKGQKKTPNLIRRKER